jgi:alcohol dehydrogenase
MNPYYAVLYSKAIQRQLRVVGRIFASHGLLDGNAEELTDRALAEAVAKAWMNFARSIGAPTKLSDLEGFSEKVHVERAVAAAKDPDLKMKLQNMPVSMTADDIEPYMRPLLVAASRGDLSLIKEM